MWSLGYACTGALFLATAGLLTGRRATTHWTSRAELARLGATVVEERVGRGGKDARVIGEIVAYAAVANQPNAASARGTRQPRRDRVLHALDQPSVVAE